MKYLVVGVLVFAILAGIAYWKFAPDLTQKAPVAQDVTLNMWGIWEDEPIIRQLINEYHRIHPNITITYTTQNLLNYRNRVQAKIDNNEGPDIFALHNTWLSMFLKTNQLAVLPPGVLSVSDYNSQFFPVAKQSFGQQGKIYGISHDLDGLILYYNEDLLKGVGASVPQSWDQLVDTAVKTTVIDQQGNIKTAGAALGTTTNVDYWSDILGLLFLQQPTPDPKQLPQNLEQPNTPLGAQVLKFYTDFAAGNSSKKVWDEKMENSTQSFAKGAATFYFGPASKITEIKNLNPSLNFKTAPVPQLLGRNVAWANFWGYGVSSKSLYSKDAWDFLVFLSSQPAQRFFYQQTTQAGGIGKPYSRIDMQIELSDNPLLGAVVNQGPIYKSWYLAASTQDQGINDEMIGLFKDAVDNVLRGQNPLSILQGTAVGVSQVLVKYTPQPPTPAPTKP